MIVEVDGQKYVVQCSGVGKLSLELIPDFLTAWFAAVGLNFIISINDKNFLQFVYTLPFKIIYMTYNLKICCGFYYIREGSKYDFPLVSDVKGDINQVMSRAVPFASSTPVLYILANIGNSCYRMGLDGGNIQGGSVGMIINNSYYAGSPLVAQQADIVCRCVSSDLTFIRLALVDSNFRKIKLLNPLFATMSINEVGDAD
jgi:hypothetical protein